MADTNTFALLAQESGSGGGGIGTILIFALIPIGMYFLMIRPQRRRQREAAELQNSIGVGDEIITTSGIYGFITGEDGHKLWLEIDDDVQIRIARAAVQRKIDPEFEAEQDAAATSSGKSDKSDKSSTKEIEDGKS